MGEVFFEWGTFLLDDLVLGLLEISMPFSVAWKRSRSSVVADVGGDSSSVLMWMGE